jgi:hypothetical protein
VNHSTLYSTTDERRSVIKQWPLKVAIALLIAPLVVAPLALSLVYTAKWFVSPFFPFFRRLTYVQLWPAVLRTVASPADDRVRSGIAHGRVRRRDRSSHVRPPSRESGQRYAVCSCWDCSGHSAADAQTQNEPHIAHAHDRVAEQRVLDRRVRAGHRHPCAASSAVRSASPNSQPLAHLDRGPALESLVQPTRVAALQPIRRDRARELDRARADPAALSWRLHVARVCA